MDNRSRFQLIDESSSKYANSNGGEVNEGEEVGSEIVVYGAVHEGSEASDSDYLDEDYQQSESDGDLFNDLFDDNKLYEENVDIEGIGNMGKELSSSESDDCNYSDDDLRSIDSSTDSDENEKKKRKLPRFHQFRMKTDLRSPKFIEGMLFANAYEFRCAVKEAFINEGRVCEFVKNDWHRIRVKCKNGPTCPYVVYASVNGKPDKTRPELQVKTVNLNHSCGRDDKNRHVSSKWLADRYEHKFTMHPEMKHGTFTDIVREDYMCEISRWQAYRAKRRAEKRTEGCYVEQYAKLPDYCTELLRSNPGSTVQLQLAIEGASHRFERLYICFAALKKGFKESCRPIVGLDGCHIKGPHPGQLLSAVGIDANNGFYPIAFAIVEAETRDSWTWFIEKLAIDLEIVNSNAWVFISDQEKGLIKAIEKLMPNSEHRFCVGHLYKNFKKKHPGLGLKHKLWDCARATTVAVFKEEMELLKQLDTAAYNSLNLKDPAHWSMSHFDTFSRCDMLLNNLCESFNAKILHARDKPIIGMLERLMMYLMLRMTRQRYACDKWNSEIGPRIHKIIEGHKVHASKCNAKLAGEKRYQVTTNIYTQYDVDLAKRTCSCRRFQLTGLPCGHAIACISKRLEDPILYVDDCYKKNAWRNAYRPYIAPMGNENEWVKSGQPPIVPPTYHKQRGRPKTARVRDASEPPPPVKRTGDKKLARSSHIKITCGICHVEGHNKRRCPEVRRANGAPSDVQIGATSSISSSAPNSQI